MSAPVHTQLESSAKDGSPRVINFRYRVLKHLGSGATGDVLLVEDALDRARLAMKIYHQKGEADLDDELFRNEVSTLLQLDHPNLLGMHDAGTISQVDSPEFLGRRFLVMEYVDGKDALTWFADVKSRDARILLMKPLLLQALSVLDYVHREGVIHFDVKPENFLLKTLPGSSDPRLKLADFGFSTRREASVELPLRGTLQYVAPELLQGRQNDHRVDLFSLGATFFHLLEGVSPFEAPNPMEVIKKVLTDDPLFSPGGAEVPLALSSTLKGLMEKDPDRRLRSGREAAGVLMQGSESVLSSYFSEKARFVGRVLERRRIEDTIRGLKDRKAGAVKRVIVITGTEGMGKTALLKELVRYARSQDLLVVPTKVSERGGALDAVLPAIMQLHVQVRCYPGVPGRSEGDRILGKYSSVLSQVGSLGEEQAISSKWLDDRESLVGMLSKFIVECSALFPFLLACDDVDRMDTVSSEVLRSVACEAPGKNLLVVAAQSRSAIDLFSADVCEVVPLGEFGLGDVRALTDSVLGSDEENEAVGKTLHELYGGIPAVLVQALHALSESRKRALDAPGGDLGSDVGTLIRSLPQNVAELLSRRYSELDEERRLVVSVISCFHYPAGKEILFPLLPFDKGRVLAHLHSLEAQCLLSSSQQGGRLSVRLGMLKKSVYESLEERRLIHTRIVEVLEGWQGEKTSSADAAELGYQLEACGETTRASNALERAADLAAEILSFQESMDLYARALSVASSAGLSDREPGLKIKLSQALQQGGRFKEALSLAQEVRLAFPAGKAIPIGLTKTIGVCASRLGDYEIARGALQEALRDSPDGHERMDLQQELVGLELNAGNYDVAEHQCRKQLEIAAVTQNERLAAAASTDLGILAFHRDRFEEAVTHFSASAQKYGKIGNQIRVTDAMMNIGNVMSAKGDFHNALEEWGAALRLCKESGTIHQQAQIRNNMGIAHYRLKDYQSARRCYSDARDLFKVVGSKSGTAYVQTNLGEVCLAEGQYEAAISHWTEVLLLYEAMEDNRGLVETHLELAHLRLILGDLETVEEDLRQAKSVILNRDLSMFEGVWRCLDGQVRCMAGDHARARESFTDAIEFLTQETEMERRLFCRVRIAACNFHENEREKAASVLLDIIASDGVSAFPNMLAEAYLVLGMSARGSQTTTLEKPVTYFRKGFEIVEQQPVSELTWRLAFALGEEFQRRGQDVRAIEYLQKARLVLQFFLSGLPTAETRRQYLSDESRARVLKLSEMAQRHES